MRSDFLEVASGEKSGSCPDHRNTHTRTFNKLNLFVSVFHIQIECLVKVKKTTAKTVYNQSCSTLDPKRS